MRQREPRHKIFVQARVRASGDWIDAKILNVSSRGMLVRASEPLSRGAYIEIRRDAQVIVGKIVWANGTNLGVRTQDRIDIAQLVGRSDVARSEVRQTLPDGSLEERRAHPRQLDADHLRQKGERSRQLASMLQYGVFAMSAVVIALIAAHSIKTIVVAPLTAITDRLRQD